MPGLKQVFIQALTEVSTEAKDTLGDIRWEGNKVYKYVELLNSSATVTGTANDMCVYRLGLYAAHTVCTDSTDAAAKTLGAGLVLVALAGTTTVSYFIWVQIKGAATIATAFGSIVDGDALTMHATTDKLFIVGATSDDPIIAVADDESAQQVILDCPF